MIMDRKAFETYFVNRMGNDKARVKKVMLFRLQLERFLYKLAIVLVLVNLDVRLTDVNSKLWTIEKG